VYKKHHFLETIGLVDFEVGLVDDVKYYKWTYSFGSVSKYIQ